jgi:cytochrome P450 family 109
MNPFSPQDQLLQPHECFTALREMNEPVAYKPPLPFWQVFDYKNVNTLLTNHQVFSSEVARHATALIQFAASLDEMDFQNLLNTDPPQHKRLRSLTSQAFTPRTVAQLAPRIASIANELLDGVIAKGSMDIVQDFSALLPATVICELIGIPPEDRAIAKQWDDDLTAAQLGDMKMEGNPGEASEDSREQYRATLKSMSDYFLDLIEQRRRNPQPDLLSNLIIAQDGEERLSDAELVSFCSVLRGAGTSTITNLIGNAILCFDEHPEVVDQLRKNPALMPKTIDEVLRYRSPVTAIARATTQDTILGGKQVPKGQFVIGWVACANHDPSQFDHPERFDIERSPNKYVSFGHGIHFCLGGPIAKLETEIALNVLLERLQDIRVNRDEPLPPYQRPFFSGPQSLPVTFTAR